MHQHVFIERIREIYTCGAIACIPCCRLMSIFYFFSSPCQILYAICALRAVCCCCAVHCTKHQINSLSLSHSFVCLFWFFFVRSFVLLCINSENVENFFCMPRVCEIFSESGLEESEKNGTVKQFCGIFCIINKFKCMYNVYVFFLFCIS